MDNKNNKIKISVIIFLVLLLSLSFASAAELDLKINAQIDDFDADFYAQTDTGSTTGFDYLDSELRSYPSGNYSFLYSAISGYNLILDSWPASSNPRTLSLVYDVSPTTVAGTVSFSWNSITSGYTATLYDYGADSSRTTLVSSGTTAMNSVSSYSATSFSGGKRYLKVVINTVSSGTGTTTGSGSGTTTSVEEEEECTPSCPFTSQISCGQSLGTNGCGGTCSGTGTFCLESEGICNLALGKCISCSDICSSLGYECGVHDVCGISTNCNTCALGKSCNAEGKCVDKCTDTCSSLGYDCGKHTICGVEQECGGCGSRKVCSSGKCGDGDKLEDEKIPLNVPRKAGCTPDVFCGDFGECNANYDIYNLITGSQVSGVQSRECIDKNNCMAKFILKQPCTLKQEVYAVNKVWCGKNYTEVRDASGKVVARVRTLADGRAVTVDFNLESEGYCPACYNGIQDGDEANVDCGGSCVSCSYVKEKLMWYKDPEYLLFFSLLLFFILLISFWEVAKQTYRYYKERIMLHLWMRRYHHWHKKGYDAGVLHRDYHAIKKHYEVLKKRLN